MLCQRCKKNQATVSCVEEINGKKIGYNLCRECYTEMFGSFSSAVNNDILAGLFGQPAKRHARICPVCGTVYSDFERTGLLGCASCYDVFKEELMPYIERIQVGVAFGLGLILDEFDVIERAAARQGRDQ